MSRPSALHPPIKRGRSHFLANHADLVWMCYGVYRYLCCSLYCKLQIYTSILLQNITVKHPTSAGLCYYMITWYINWSKISIYKCFITWSKCKCINYLMCHKLWHCGKCSATLWRAGPDMLCGCHVQIAWHSKNYFTGRCSWWFQPVFFFFFFLFLCALLCYISTSFICFKILSHQLL